MDKLKIAFDFFAATALRNWPGLFWYLAGWLMYRATGLRLFNERTLRFRAFSVVARHVVLECHSRELEMECRRQLNDAGFQVEQKNGLLFAHR